MGYRRLFVVRKDLHMSAGKMSAQLAHCAEAYWLRFFASEKATSRIVSADGEAHVCFGDIHLPEGVVTEYVNGMIVKTICQARNRNQLLKAGDLAKAQGLVEGRDYGFIYDACLTELTPEEENGTCLTAFWTAPIPDETAHAISRKYHLYTDNAKES